MNLREFAVLSISKIVGSRSLRGRSMNHLEQHHLQVNWCKILVMDCSIKVLESQYSLVYMSHEMVNKDGKSRAWKGCFHAFQPFLLTLEGPRGIHLNNIHSHIEGIRICNSRTKKVKKTKDQDGPFYFFWTSRNSQYHARRVALLISQHALGPCNTEEH